MEAVGRLAAGVAHDFNNSLQVILGNAELVAAELPTDHGQQLYLDAVLRAGRQARDVVRHLLAFSRRQEPSIEPVDLVAVVRRQVGVLRSLLGADIHVRVAAPADLPPAAADAAQVEEVLLNLCLNARDAMPDGGILDITLESVNLDADGARLRGAPAAGSYLVLGVRDEGEGIPPDLHDRVYDPFFTTKDVDRGTGLGLATVHGIVGAHRGYIEMDSAPGRGSCFRIGWPAAVAGHVELPAPTSASDRILVVDDEPGVRQVAEAALTRAGYEVDTASDGAEALERLQNVVRRYDVVVMDVTLPGLNGWAVYTRARRTHPGLKVVFCSGHTPALLETEFQIEMPALQFLQKPYGTEELVRRVQELLARPALEAREERG
jgi:CheY-like chemotaxis protein